MLSILRRQVGAKIILGYMITLSLMLGVGLLAISRLDQISTTVNDLTNNLALDMRLADEMVSQVLLSRFYANRYVSTQSQADLDRFDAEFSALQALLQSLILVAQLGDLSRLRSGLRATLLRRQGLQSTGPALLTPFVQVRAVEPFPA